MNLYPIAPDEIRAIGQLDHHHVVRLFDADVTSDGASPLLWSCCAVPRCKSLRPPGFVGALARDR